MSFLLVNCVNTATRQYNNGLKQQSLGFNDNAIVLFKKSIENGGSKSKLNFLIGENYRTSNRIQEAAHFYAEAIKAKSKDDKLGFYYAQSLKALGNYEEARIGFEKYAKTGLNANLKKQAAKEMKFLKEIKPLIYKETYYNVKNAGEYLNTEGPEYAPSISKEGEIVYTAANEFTKYKATGTGFTDIYTFKPDNNLEGTGTKRAFEPQINKANTHEACQAISPDGTLVVFVRSNDGKRKGAVDTDLYFVEMRDGEWTKPALLPFSEPRAWESTPAFSPDGKILYFASNKRGGFGGIDLYKVFLTDSGWTKSQNLGQKINTSGNEMFPYLRSDNKFFFASDGHPGLGGLDLFVALEDSTILDSAKTEEGIVNLGPPMNTSADDFGIVYKEDLKAGYFASNRQGGKGDDDIYEFWLGAKPRRPIVKDVVAILQVSVACNGTESTKSIPLDSAKVELEFESGEDFKDSISANGGTVSFVIDTNSTFILKTQKKGYFTSNVTFASKGGKFVENAVSEELIYRYYNVAVLLDKPEVGKEIVLKNIFYDYNKSDIRPEAEPDLLLLIDFLKNNPEVVVELGSHTDSRGNDDYNTRLSQARAQSAVDYILANGIDADRIKAIGYGETKHIIEDAVTEEEHQQNRRTEFKILAIE
ncbi:MAG: OmpA family protein [Cytophagales bacterium]